MASSSDFHLAFTASFCLSLPAHNCVRSFVSNAPKLNADAAPANPPLARSRHVISFFSLPRFVAVDPQPFIPPNTPVAKVIAVPSPGTVFIPAPTPFNIPPIGILPAMPPILPAMPAILPSPGILPAILPTVPAILPSPGILPAIFLNGPRNLLPNISNAPFSIFVVPEAAAVAPRFTI